MFLRKADFARMLGVHVFNSGIGESIVLELPGNKWGVVDCYTHSLTDHSANSALQFLRERNVARLEFVALTHPHADHFRGIGQLLECFEVVEFWRFGAFTPAQLAERLAEHMLSEATCLKPGEIENADCFTSLLGQVEHLHRAKRIKQLRFLVGEQSLYPLPREQAGILEIRSFAPTGNMVNKYQNRIVSCFDGDHFARHRAKNPRHNQVSAALHLRYGETVVLLCGDVEKAGWKDALQNFGPQALDSDVVKVSHHGSSTGYIKSLWASFSRTGKPVAVVTPYELHNLPHSDALRHIMEHSESLYSTSLASMPRTRASYDLLTDRMLNATFKEIQPLTSPGFLDFKSGRCSFLIEPDGQIRCECSGNAGLVKPTDHESQPRGQIT